MYTDCSQDAIKYTFYQKMNDLLRTTKHDDIVILAENVNPGEHRLILNEAHLEGSFGLGSCRWGSRKVQLFLCSDHHVFRNIVNFKRCSRPFSSNLSYLSRHTSSGLFKKVMRSWSAFADVCPLRRNTATSPLSPFAFNFAMADTPENPLSGLFETGVHTSQETLFNLRCVNDITLLNRND